MADTRIDSRDVDLNFGRPLLRLVRNSKTDRDGSFVRGLLQFDLPNLPREDVAEARLWMVLTRARGPAGYNPYERNVVIRPLAAAFDELSATWPLRNFDPSCRGNHPAVTSHSILTRGSRGSRPRESCWAMAPGGAVGICCRFGTMWTCGITVLC